MTTNEIEILLVEDNMHDAEMTIRAFRKNNLANHLIHLKDGEEALEFLFARGRFEGRDSNMKPRLILLDLKMPKVDGIEFLSIIKSNDLTKTIPVVVLTSSKENPDIQKCYALGVNSYIVKPVEFDNFIKVLSDMGFYWLVINQNPS